MLHKTPCFLKTIVVIELLSLAMNQLKADELHVEKIGSKFRITVGDQEFAELDYSTYAKPIVYPIYGPGQIPMSRDYPMVLGTAGEATDHMHHKSIWFAHGDVNGVSFWDEKGKIITEEIVNVDENPSHPSITLRNKLVAPDGKLVAHETMKVTFSSTDNSRIIDWEETLHADVTELTLGDTKEGTMAIRTHPNLRIKGDTANGTATNSEGGTGEAIWGKKSKWVDYSGAIDGRKVGISVFDHPQNLRHPTTWHAREYGLVAANPFGISHFLGKDQNGAYKIDKGDSLHLKYRFVFHQGDVNEADVAKLYEDYAATD